MSEEESAWLTEQGLRETVANALLALATVSMGDYATRLRSKLDERNPLGALYAGINEMIQSLEAEQRQSLEYQRELEEKIATIDQQRAAIRELSTPIMEVWNGVLCLPVVGVVDTVRSAEMTSAVSCRSLRPRTRTRR
jgi:rsbT co-antagonist protein RsbR